MSVRTLISVMVVGGVLSLSGVSSAQALETAEPWSGVSSPEHSVAGARQFRAPPDTPVGRRWYGWETLSLDAAALGLAAVGFGALDGQGSGGALLGSGALTTYAFGAPAVHLMRDQPGRAVASVGLRVGLPVLAVGIASLGHEGNCPADNEIDDADICQPYARRVLLTGAISVVVASLIDSALLAWEPAPKPKQLALMPVLGWDGARAGTAGVAGTF